MTNKWLLIRAINIASCFYTPCIYGSISTKCVYLIFIFWIYTYTRRPIVNI